MPNTYSWEIQDLIVNPLEAGLANVVKKVVCEYVADDGVRTTKQLLVATLPPPDPLTFIPFENLTFAEVASWIELTFGTPSLVAWQNTLDERLVQEQWDAMECPWE